MMIRVLVLLCFMVGEAAAQYIFANGTIFDEGTGFIHQSDPSDFKTLTYQRRGTREMFDRRVNAWIDTNAFIFKATFTQGQAIEFRVHADFLTQKDAKTEALRYTHALGQLPVVMRKRVKSISILTGNALYGGGNDGIHVSAKRTNEYLARGNLEEVLFHEAAHASLDPVYGNNAVWRKAQRDDSEYISKYAFEYPKREDLAEMSLVAYAMITHPDRVPEPMKQRIKRTMPNRLVFFQKVFAQ